MRAARGAAVAGYDAWPLGREKLRCSLLAGRLLRMLVLALVLALNYGLRDV